MGIDTILSKISSPSVGFSWKSDPFVCASKRKMLSRDRPWWKCWIYTISGNPWVGQVCMRLWNLVHDWLRGSVLVCRKLITWFPRFMRRDKGKYLAQNLSHKILQSVATSFSCWKYQAFSFPASKNWKSLTLNSSRERLEYERVEHNCSKLLKWLYGFSPSNSEKGFF
jgi:hypothetical protein